MNHMHSTMVPAIPDKNRSYKPLWLTSASYEFPSCAMLNPSLSNRIALILYYAHIMDQKRVLGDFYKLCKYNFENKTQSSSLESSINAWIKNSIVKLHRRRERIISETVTSLQTQFISAISQIVFDVFCDFLIDSSKNGHITSVYARHKRLCYINWDILFTKNEMLLPIFSCADSLPFLCLMKENNKMKVSKNNSLQCLRRFWLEFCYQPDPVHYIKSIQNVHEPETSTNSRINIQNTCTMDNLNSTQYSSDDLSSLSSESNSDSSDSWSCTDFKDDSICEDDHLCSYTSNNMSVEKCNATIEWLQSTACHFDSASCHFDSDDDRVNFDEAITEENCLDSPSSRGSLCFVDIDFSDEENEYEVIFLNSSSDTGFATDSFAGMSQGFENPCFEDSFSIFPVLPSFLEMVNDCWNDDMLELENKPRKPSKVSFAPEPSLVTVHHFEKTDENTFDVSLVLDNVRFRHRIKELGQILSPFLSIEHRVEVQKKNGFYED